jgi:hypothetical protein
MPFFGIVLTIRQRLLDHFGKMEKKLFIKIFILQEKKILALMPEM